MAEGYRGAADLSMAEPAAQPSGVEQGWLFPAQADDAYHESIASEPGRRATFEPPTSRFIVWQLLAAAVVGVVLGAGVAWIVLDRTGDAGSGGEGVASSTLAGFNGHDASGDLQVLQTSTGQQLKVDLVTSEGDKGFIQVWLLNAKTNGMVALGVLDNDHGTFNIPQGLDLGRYNQVDVSLEPYDGDPAHSSTSLARGPVP
jgi:hypothetical protein